MRLSNFNFCIPINDISMFLIVIVTLAFHDSSMLLAVCQVIGCFFIYNSKLSGGMVDVRKIKYIYWLGLFSLFCVLSVFWASHPSNVLITVRSVLQVAMTGFSVLLYIDNEDRCYKVLRFITVGSIILVFRLLIYVPSYAWGTERVGNYIGYGNNSAALVLAYAAICTFYLFLRNHLKRNIFFTLFFIVFSLLCGSKKALIISILGVGCLMVANSKNVLQLFKRFLFVIIISIVLFYMVMNIEPLYNVLGNRVERMLLALTGESGGDMSTLDRMLFAKNAAQVFFKHPIIGVGLDNYRFNNYMTYYAHNNYLEIAADLGLIGFVLYYWFPFQLCFESLKRIKFKKFLIVSILLIIILIMDVANVSYETDSIQLYIAVAYAIFIQLSSRDKEVEKK